MTSKNTADNIKISISIYAIICEHFEPRFS